VRVGRGRPFLQPHWCNGKRDGLLLKLSILTNMSILPMKFRIPADPSPPPIKDPPDPPENPDVPVREPDPEEPNEI